MNSPDNADARSRRALGFATLGAAGVAALVLVAAVLPAEYGVDPLGTGKALGLTALAGPAEPIATTPSASASDVPTGNGPIAAYGAPFRADSVDLTLGPYEFIEYKYRLEQGASMVYSWAADGDLIHDMHGERDGGAPDAAESFDQQPRRQGDGTFTASFAGIHGWFWENPGAATITIKVRSAGFYTSALELRSNRTRVPHPLMSVDELFARENTREKK